MPHKLSFSTSSFNDHSEPDKTNFSEIQENLYQESDKKSARKPSESSKTQSSDDNRKLKLNQIAKNRYIHFLFMIIFSVVFHAVIFQWIYGCIHRPNATKSTAVHTKVYQSSYINIKPSDPDSLPQKIKRNKKAFEKRSKKKLSNRQLVSLGKQKATQKGHFPGLIISYADPVQYIKDLYALDAITVFWNSFSLEYTKVNLFKNRLYHFKHRKLNKYSRLKRVIRDKYWESSKHKWASKLKTDSHYLELIALIPNQLEYLWIGHQANIIEKRGLKLSDITSVEGLFHKRKLYIQALTLSTGERLKINDPSGV